MSFAAVDIIRAKRDKGVLSDAQIDWVVDAYTKGVVADEQMAALNMATVIARSANSTGVALRRTYQQPHPRVLTMPIR